MAQSIDVLVIEPQDADARRTLDAIHRKAPQASTVRVLSVAQAERLIFERGLFSERPQPPRVIIVDIVALGDPARAMVRRLKSEATTQEIPVVALCASRNQSDILENHLLGVVMSIMKPVDADEYTSAVERIIATWFANPPQ